MRKKLTKVSSKEAKSLTSIEDAQFIEDAIGKKLWSLKDKDPWHLVGIVDDGDDGVVVMKSWSKYKQRWIYECENVFVFLWDMASLNHLYRDEEGNFVIKECKERKVSW